MDNRDNENSAHKVREAAAIRRILFLASGGTEAGFDASEKRATNPALKAASTRWGITPTIITTEEKL